LHSLGVNPQVEDLQLKHLGLLDGSAAREFIFLALAGQGIVIQQNEIDQVLDLIGQPIPYFLQVFLDLLSNKCREKKDPAEDLTGADINRIYEQELLGPQSKRYFESISCQLDRYAKYGEANREGANAILDALATSDSMNKNEVENVWQMATSGNAKLEVMLNILNNDFYVEQTDGKVFFGSKLLRDWWALHSLGRKR
jgi:hypothetical protein